MPHRPATTATPSPVPPGAGAPESEPGLVAGPVGSPCASFTEAEVQAAATLIVSGHADPARSLEVLRRARGGA